MVEFPTQHAIVLSGRHLKLKAFQKFLFKMIILSPYLQRSFYMTICFHGKLSYKIFTYHVYMILISHISIHLTGRMVWKLLIA